MKSLRTFIILALLAASAVAAPPTTCNMPGAYEQALCSYQRRNFAEAERGFRTIVDAAAKEPRTIRATYFLARTLMKSGHFDEAAGLLIRIYDMDPAFYAAWSCDYLLGECRKAMGKG